MKYTIYIDESGDAGLKKIRTRTSDGASPYMTMCACMIPNTKKEEVVEKIEQMRETLGVREMHTTNLKHSQKVFCAREVSQLRLRLFGVVSNKRTLKEYAKSIDGNSEKYYNK